MRAFLLMAMAAVVSCSALAQEAFPSKPVHIVVGFPPGGGADVVARAVAAKMNESLGEAIARAGITRIDEVPVVDGLTATLKMAEAMVDFKRNGISVTRRGYTHARPPREMVEHARKVHGRPDL